jgi:hypothetical protein
MIKFKYTDDNLKKLKEYKYWKEEIKKCKESPYYFWKNYVQYEGKQDLTEEEYNKLLSDRISQPIKGRRNLMQYPKTINECFKSTKIL